MYGENTKTIAIPIYRVLPYPVIHAQYGHMCIRVKSMEHRYMLCEWAGNITGGFTAIRIVDCDYSLVAVVD